MTASDRTRARHLARRPRRDAERTARAILDAALVEFSDHGPAGARIDAIAERSGSSKPMIYSYFGDKEGLYAAALREAYLQIRAGERELDLVSLAPRQAIGALVDFTLEHYRSRPWFIRMLNSENLRGGATIRTIADASEIQSPLIDELGEILRRGAAAGTFRRDVCPVDLYITIASLFYFPISNAHTLRAVFGYPGDDAGFERRRCDVRRMVLGFLAPDAQ